MRQLFISIGVIKQNNAYLLQKRSDDPGIGAAGKIGAFGGKVERGETPAKAVCRELAEETSLKLSTDDVRHITTYKVESDHQLEPVKVHVDVFEITVDAKDAVRASEGEIVRITETEVPEMLTYMTPATRYYFERVKG